MTKRIINSTISGRQLWFDADKAVCIEEDTYFDGNNTISRATDSQWGHEALYYTRTGRWILHSWSNWQGSADSYEEIDETAAFEWMLVNASKAEIALLPPITQSRFAQHQASTEV